jgi:hypothetical protein
MSLSLFFTLESTVQFSKGPFIYAGSQYAKQNPAHIRHYTSPNVKYIRSREQRQSLTQGATCTDLRQRLGGCPVYFHDVEPKQSGDAKDRKDLQDFPWVPGSDFSLDKLRGRVDHGGESPSGHVLLDELVFLVPLVAQPQIKLLLIVKRDISDTKPAPVEVDGFRRTSFEVSTIQAEDFFSVFASANNEWSVFADSWWFFLFCFC